MPTLLITGSNRGLGFEFARQYAADQWQVIACCRSPEKAHELQALAKANPALKIEPLDLADDQSIDSLAARLKGTAIDLLVNCAGIFSGTGLDGHHFLENGPDITQAFGSLDSAAWAKVLRINTIAPIMVSQALKNNLFQGKGRTLIMISSRMGSIERIYRAGDIAYRTSKAALNAAVKSISYSLHDAKITVACFHPGWVQTDMGSKSAELTPEQSVSSIRRVISTLKLENSGQFLNYDGQPIPW